ncbi:hypothetical protein ACS0TY_006918 [Phlomoides rotata]
MTIKSGTGQACAACKYQRRRCTPECLLAPFFPADQPKMFQNVHRLFGVKNIQNLLKELGPDQAQKAMAMKSIKFHAMMRDKYPVFGCLTEIHQLNWQIHAAQEELQATIQQLAYYRQHHQNHQDMSDDYISELQLGMAPPGATNRPLFNADFNIHFLENNNNSLCQPTFSNSNDNENNHNSIVMQPPPHLMIPPHTLKPETGHDFNDMQPFFDSIDDTHSYIGSKDLPESSLESSLKDSRTHLVEEMDENELKGAATCFSLISIN